jgi:hypothetical protein
MLFRLVINVISNWEVVVHQWSLSTQSLNALALLGMVSGILLLA